MIKHQLSGLISHSRQLLLQLGYGLGELQVLLDGSLEGFLGGGVGGVLAGEGLEEGCVGEGLLEVGEGVVFEIGR